MSEIINPIDPDKVAEQPGLLEYGHHSGSAVIKPTDRGKIKSNALSAMYEQTDAQLAQIKKQVDLLLEQAKAIKQREELSNDIYNAKMSFDPLIGRHYFLYIRKDGTLLLSMVAPEEWGKKLPFKEFRGEVKLLHDHTWEIIRDEY